MLSQGESPPPTGSGSRLGFVVIIVAGNYLSSCGIINVNRCVCIHCNMHIPLFNLVATEKLSQTYSAAIRRQNPPHVSLSCDTAECLGSLYMLFHLGGDWRTLQLPPSSILCGTFMKYPLSLWCLTPGICDILLLRVASKLSRRRTRHYVCSNSCSF